jgi:rhodanese-related sulfurtransferase
MIKSITREELKERMEQGHKFHLVDVLAPETYENKHIKGAINIPMTEISKKARKMFDLDDDIVVYCSGFSCKASPTAAKTLDDLGFTNVFDYEGGREDWEEAGLPIERKE